MRDLLARHGAADLVTATADGLQATLLPFLYEPTVGKHGRVYGHLARGEALAIVRWTTSYAG